MLCYCIRLLQITLVLAAYVFQYLFLAGFFNPNSICCIYILCTYNKDLQNLFALLEIKRC